MFRANKSRDLPWKNIRRIYKGVPPLSLMTRQIGFALCELQIRACKDRDYLHPAALRNTARSLQLTRRAPKHKKNIWANADL